MYQDYFRLIDLPFRVTPEPQFLYSNPGSRNGYAALRDGINSRKGLIVITGEIGTGKTTLLTTFLQNNLDPALQSAVILNPSFSFAELLRFALHDLGIPSSSDNETELLERFNDYAAQETARGHNVALFLDEAQTLSVDVLEQLLRLSNLASDEDKLVQLILIGQPELDQKLNQPKLLQLKRRVSLHETLAPLTPEEVRGYIEFRLAKAGYRGKPLFDPAAVGRITFYSAGIPRLINIICDNALLIALGLSKKKVSAAIVDEVADDLHLEVPRRTKDIASGLEDYKGVQRRATGSPRQHENFFRGELLGRRSATTLAAGLAILLVFGFLTGASSALYNQGSSLVSSMASGVGHLFRANTNGPVRVQSRPQVDRDNTQDSWPDFRQSNTELTRILMKNKERNPASGTRAGIDSSEYHNDVQTTVVPAIPAIEDELAPLPRKKRVAPSDGDVAARTIEPSIAAPIRHQPDRQSQKARAPQYWPHDEATGTKPRKADREQRFFQGLFEVTADSLVFDQPRMESALLKTLRPGSQVRVEQKVGNFLLVRSMKDPGMSGYVPFEDAYLKRIQ
jgi:type II secretory pathway predicted ATPase ExeA